MTNGASQGLFVILAVVIFGIFILISYLLFGDKMKTSLATIFGDSIEQSQDALETEESVPQENEVIEQYNILPTGLKTISRGTSITITVKDKDTNLPINIGNGSFIVSKQNIVEITSSGVVTGKSAGTVKIYFKDFNNKVSKILTVNVKQNQISGQ